LGRGQWRCFLPGLSNSGMPVHPLEGAFRHGWPETEAEVTSCRYIPARYGRFIHAAYYVVGFTYMVDGTAYGGATTSSVEVECKDKFSVRYNPEHPEENNSLASMCDRAWFNDSIYIVGALFLGLLLYNLVDRVMRYR
jgi:hypothetical protein